MATIFASAIGAHRARADGAFPDSQNILAPADRPHELVLSTNFGLVTSEDDGVTWIWSCEQDANSFASFYQLGAPPLHRLYAVAVSHLVYSDDGGCSWKTGAGALTNAAVLDAFADPTQAQRVLVVATPNGGAPTVYESSDAGATFGDPRYVAAAGDTITGVEIARADPKTVYLTISSGSTFIPKLARSTDGGATWKVQDLGDKLGTGSLRLVAVDPVSPDKVFLRFGATTGERLAVTTDAGLTVTTPVVLDGGVLTSFARMTSGTLMAGAVIGTDQALFRSADGGKTFQRLRTSPSLRALAARGSVLYAAADNFNDGYAVGMSADEGMTWQPLMHYDQIQAVDACAKSVCGDSCLNEVDLGLWPAAVCEATPPPKPDAGGPPPLSDAGSADAGGAGAAGTDARGSDAGVGKPPTSGCHCGVARAPASSLPSLALLALGLLLARRRR